MDSKDVLSIAMQQLAVGRNCTPEDLCQGENKVAISKENPKARCFLKLPTHCNLVSFGNNILASINADISDFVLDYTEADAQDGIDQ